MKTASLWTNKYFVAVMAVIACILWGSAFPVLKITYQELQIGTGDVSARMLIAGARFLLAGLILIVVQKFVFRKSVSIPSKGFMPLLLLGLAQTGLQYFFFYNGVANSTGIKSAILNSVGNFFVVLFAHFIYPDDKLNTGKVFGLITGFAGIILVNWQTGASGMSWDFSFKGEGFLILAGLASVLGTFQAKKLTASIDPVTTNAYQLILGSCLLLVLGLPALADQSLQPTPLFWVLFVYSALLSAIAFSIWYNLLKYNKAGEVTIYRFVIPVSGAILSGLLLPNEALTPSTVLALLLVALGIGAVNRWQARNVQPTQSGESG